MGGACEPNNAYQACMQGKGCTAFKDCSLDAFNTCAGPGLGHGCNAACEKAGWHVWGNNSACKKSPPQSRCRGVPPQERIRCCAEFPRDPACPRR